MKYGYARASIKSGKPVPEVAELLGVSRATLYRRVA
ncbi:MAG: helix-turn-helix domain-containing protein [Steroidobacteraceae bacterium]